MKISFYRKTEPPPPFNMFLYPDPEGRARAKADYEREYAEAVAAKDTPLFTAELLPGWRLEACGEEGRKATFYILHEL